MIVATHIAIELMLDGNGLVGLVIGVAFVAH
jgi:hypothetical protein